jgi:hypothetical protein
MPPAAVAREAVTAALEGWRRDKPPDRVDNGSRTVEIADTHRREGQTLADFDVLGELAPDSGRRFAVRLQLENPSQVEKAQFVVVGINPLWVFRQEDFDMIAHWDHPMPEAGGVESSEGKTPPPKAAEAEESTNE